MALSAQPADTNAAAIARGVDFLKKEAPKWTLERNSEATRALLAAGAKGHDVGTSLDETLAFLKQPATWDQSKAVIGTGNKTLAYVRLSSALAAAERNGKAPAASLEAAAKLLVAEQQPDGTWERDQSPAVGSPATYGTILAAWSARSTLISSGMQPDNFTIVQIDKWARGLTPENVLDASATVLVLELSSDVMAENLRRTCLSILRQGQQEKTGGWGLEATTAPQVFDTAIAVLALSSLQVEPRLARSAFTPDELKEVIAKGKQFIVSQQRPDGSWPETTRPANQENYGQRISTTGWAMLALLSGP